MTQVSVVIPSYNSSRTISSCLECVRHQHCDTDYEIIVVDSSNDGADQIIERDFPDVKLIRLTQKTGPGTSRNLGVAQASGTTLAFTDADCKPAADWLQSICNSMQSGKDIVGGSVENGCPESMISRAEYFIEFREFSSDSPKRNVRFLPSCNFAIKRDIFELSEGFPDIRASEDTLFAHTLTKLGYNIWFDPDIRIQHLNRNKLKPFLANQFILGKYAAVVRKSLPMPGGFFVKIPYAFPVLPIVRTIRTLQFVSNNSLKEGITQLFDFILIYPVFLLGSISWSIGFFKGAKSEDGEPLQEKRDGR